MVWSDLSHIGSMPKGYTQSSYAAMGVAIPFWMTPPGGLGYQQELNRGMLSPVKSFYIQPMNMAQKPICRIIYFTSPSLSLESSRQSRVPIRKSKVPWRMSPNMTPNSKGKVIALKRVGLISF